MSRTPQLVQDLVARGEVRISEHGYDELSADGISVRDLLVGVVDAEVVEGLSGLF
jgi:hypothetical protein